MQNADKYSEVNKSTEKMTSVLRLLERERPLMTWDGGPEVALDAGCGPGDVTALVLRSWLPSGSFVLGADVSPTMVDHANSLHGDPPHLHYAVADLASREDVDRLLEVDPGYAAGFTKIVSLFALHWLHDLRACVSNLYYLLRPGGEALLTFPVDRLFQKTYAKMRASKRWRDHFKGVSRNIPTALGDDAASEFPEMMRQAGFEIVKCEAVYSRQEYESVDKFKGLVESLDPDFALVPDNLKEDYLEDCLENLKNIGAVKTEDQGCTLSQLILTCVARKPRNFIVN